MTSDSEGLQDWLRRFRRLRGKKRVKALEDLEARRKQIRETIEELDRLKKEKKWREAEVLTRRLGAQIKRELDQVFTEAETRIHKVYITKQPSS